MEEFLKHLRSTHFGLIITSIVILLTLFGGATKYNEAIEQLDDIIEATTSFESENVVKNIKGQLPQYSQILTDFLDEALSEYLGDNITQDFALRFDLQSFCENWEEYCIFEDEYWNDQNSVFHSHSAFLRRQAINVYLFDDSIYSHQENIGKIKSGFNSLLSIEKVMYSPDLYTYFTNPSAFTIDNKKEIDLEKIGEKTEKFKSPKFSFELKDVILTTDDDREKYEEAVYSLEEDPEWLYNSGINPDILVFSVKATDQNLEWRASQDSEIAFILHLPLMFASGDPSFINSLLTEAFPGKRYNARFASGENTFAGIFPELDEVTQNLDDIKPKELRAYLNQRSSDTEAVINVLGINVPRGLIGLWGGLLLVGIQLYFSVHFSQFIDNYGRYPIGPFPWVGIYRGGLSKILFLISLSLPVIVCASLIWSQISAFGTASDFSMILAVVSLALSMALCAKLVQSSASTGKVNTEPELKFQPSVPQPPESPQGVQSRP